MLQKTAYGQGSPFLRGFTGFRTLCLIDGIRLNNSTGTTGYVDIDNTVAVGGTNVVLIPAGLAPVRYGSVSGPPVTITVVSATDPGVANYPEGALWIQP
jgi:hemoglobin/transferrin/lactoferrin receptor protein